MPRKPMKFRQEVICTRAYDLRSAPGGNNYGQHNMELRFRCHRGRRFVELAFQTAWGLPSQRGITGPEYRPVLAPQGIFWQAVKSNGGTTDVSYLWAREWTEGFIAGGTTWLWPKLEQSFEWAFENGPKPDLTPIPLTYEEANRGARSW